MLSVSEVARIWQAAGVSIIPILDNQTKRPSVRWSPYQAVAPTLEQVNEWWGNGKPYGLALICGAVSGNLEMCELEGRAMVSDKLQDLINRMDELGVGHVWDLLYGPEGFTETSPSGGLHFLYRISDHEVPGNTKIARRPATEEELSLDPQDKLKVLAETRGHGGYVITAPTPGICHPSGEPWLLREGRYGILPTITWQERNLFHEALRLALDESAPAASTPSTNLQPVSAFPSGSVANAGTVSPGDDFEAHTDWAEILEPHGWLLESRHGAERHWTRPGKERRDGASATTGRAGDRDRLYVFSTSTIFESEVPYTKFGAYALLNHGGDHRAAAQELVRQGFGEHRLPVPLDAFLVPPSPPTAEAEPDDQLSLDDVGNGMRLVQQVQGNYRYIWEEKRFYRWTGSAWVHDFDGGITREMVKVTAKIAERAKAQESEVLLKWSKSSRSAAKIKAAVELSKHFGLSHSAGDWNPNRHLLNVRNGVLDLKSGTLLPHDRSYLMTNTFGASYDPQASCPQFENFMQRALPDPAMRAYVQRALGYSLLGDADQRAMFLIYGPSGTGKSTLMDTMRELFADYGATAPAGTFRTTRGGDKAPTNDLHMLRGSRFVATSETAEAASFDEDLLKRITGRDKVTSRALYQEHVEWVPEFTLWLATNHMPRLNSDDDAIWRRVKLIPFNTVFLGDGQVSDMARTVLLPEADGILNWLLAGLQDFLEHGINEPEQVQALAKEERVQADSVARFMDDRIVDGMLLLEEGAQVRTQNLYAMYLEWSRLAAEKPLGNRRFTNRLQSHYPHLTQVRVAGHLVWSGLGVPVGSWLGTGGGSS